jgi:hypothetical protein
MGTGERLHRTDPERSGPIRDAATYLRDAPPGDAGPASSQTADTPESAVAHGVRLGYKVIEEQIMQGQQLAQRLGKATGKPGATGAADATALIERVLNLYKDVGALCIDAVEAVARSSAIRTGLARASEAIKAPTGLADVLSPSAPAAGVRYSVEVASRRRLQVTLDLSMRAGQFVPRVLPLHAADVTIPPLTAVSFDLDPALSEPRLQIDVPDTQPAGTYTGVVVDSASNEPRGVVSVRLLP